MGGAVTALLVIRVARIALVATYALSGSRQRLRQHRAGDVAARERQVPAAWPAIGFTEARGKWRARVGSDRFGPGRRISTRR